MKSKTLKSFICSALACVSLFGFSACNLEAQTAYDVAVKNGFVGTEQEWLASLKGADGESAKSPTINDIYSAWLAQEGNENKSFDDFLKEYLTVDYNENNNTKKIAQNLTSAVSIYCGMYAYNSTSRSYEWGLSAGSGVIYAPNEESLKDGNAYILTNYHVLYSADAKNSYIAGSNGENIVNNNNIFIYLYGSSGITAETETDRFGKVTVTGFKDAYGTAVKASYVGGSMQYDVAVLKVEGDKNLIKAATASTPTASAVKIAKNGVTAGEKVFAIGNPSGNGISVSQGVVSVESEYISMMAADEKTSTVFHVLRTDTAINPGNSGGGLFNAQGELVGIVNAKTTTSSSGTAVENMGYALPISDVEAVAKNILANGGRAMKPYFGIMTSSEAQYTEWNAAQDKLVLKETVRVSKVYEKGEADAGIGAGVFKADDVIVSVAIYGGDDGDATNVTVFPVDTRADFTNALLHVRAGDTLKVYVKRAGSDEPVELFFEITEEKLSRIDKEAD